MAQAEWKVLRHEPLEQLADNLWFVRGTLPSVALKRTMVVARRADGTLVIHNGIALDDENRGKLEALGEPAVLIVPNAYHRLDAPAYKQRYPQLQVTAPAGSRKKIEERIAVDFTYDEYASRPGADDSVRLEMLPGVAEREGAMVVRSQDGTTVVLNDAIFNLKNVRGFAATLITRMLGNAPGPRVSRLYRLGVIKNKAEFREGLERYARLPDLARLIVAHDHVVSGADARAALETAIGGL